MVATTKYTIIYNMKEKNNITTLNYISDIQLKGGIDAMLRVIFCHSVTVARTKLASHITAVT